MYDDTFPIHSPLFPGEIKATDGIIISVQLNSNFRVKGVNKVFRDVC